MSNKETIESKVNDARKYLKELENYSQVSEKDIRKIGQVRGAVERYLQLSVQSAIDLAETVIVYKKLRKPSTLSENFDILREEKIIDSVLADKLTKMTGFRNVVVHQYRDVDEGIMIDILKNNLVDMEEFINIIEKEIVNE